MDKESLRVDVRLLDSLMDLAGELVLSRNQLVQGIHASNPKATEISSQRIDMITSELQAAIMRTRMQPIGNILNKFGRLVRDMSQNLGKSIDLIVEGNEVELDKTILEAISDPLTHLIRNAVDHGIEYPLEREQKGKQETGTITLKAFHDAGQVNIVISDDGKGLDPEKITDAAVSKGLITKPQALELSEKQRMELIFLPGFSTAETVTDISGRGVGMDVVITNIQTLGGMIELESTLGKGTQVEIKLPLTLAIIPSQIASVGGERYAVPQVNLNELLRIPGAQIKDRLEMVGDAPVIRLRGELLPLLDLSKMLGIEKTFMDATSHDILPDRRRNLADRRSRKHILSNGSVTIEKSIPENHRQNRKPEDRRDQSMTAVHIAIVSSGTYKYGLVVDQLHDAEEIVVKPVGRHLKGCTAYSGATIMGDGKVALILDIANLARMAELSSINEAAQTVKAGEETDKGKDKASLLTFKNGDKEHFAAPLELVQRIERIKASQIEQLGNNKVIQYRGGTLPLFQLSQVADFNCLPEKDQQEIIVFKVKDKEVGLMVSPPVDAVEMDLDIDDGALKQSVVSGSIIINGNTTLLIDIFEMIKML